MARGALRRLLIAGVALVALAAPAVAAGAPGDLTFVEAEVDGVGGVETLNAAGSVSAAPDGRHVYVATAFSDQAITAFARDPQTNALSLIEAEVDGVNGLDLGDMGDFAISPDGGSLYVGVVSDNALVGFARNPQTGELSFTQRLEDDTGGIQGLRNPRDVAVSPDARHVYVAGQTDEAIAVFGREPATGALTFIAANEEGVGGLEGISTVKDLVVSPDGRHLYALAQGDQTVVTFARDPAIGTLSFASKVEEGVGGVTGLGSPDSLAISADGRSVYATGNDGSGSATPSLSVFSRDPLTGALTFLRTQFRDSPGVSGINNAGRVATAPDGAQVYVAGNSGPPSFKGTLAAFGELDPSNRIGFAHAYTDDADGGSFLAGVREADVTCDGLGLYAAAATGSFAVSAFSREGGPGTCAPELELSGKSKQKLKRRKPALKLSAGCGLESCELDAAGKVKKAGKLKLTESEVPFDGETPLAVKLARKTRKKAQERLDDGRKVVATVAVLATDIAGNETTEKLKVRLKG